MSIQKKNRYQVQVGTVVIGGDAPVVIQSMTDTATADVHATTQQIIALVAAGSELVRITVDTPEAAKAVPKIVNRLRSLGYQTPIVGDFHYNGHRLLQDFPECAQSLDKYRINPGNVGFGRKKDLQFAQIIEKAIQYDKPVRIGVNWGSLDQALLQHLMDENAHLSEPVASNIVMEQALIQSVLQSAEYAEKLGLAANKIILSCKVSDVNTLINVYECLAEKSHYPLHLGLTEAGMGDASIVSTSIALGRLLSQGIGDTIRASLTPEPNASRTREVSVCQNVLQALNLQQFSPKVTACPGCGRTTSAFFRELTEDVEKYLKAVMPVWRLQYPEVVRMKIAVMGCIVNGPGESKHADIGISLPGTGESPVMPVFMNGIKTHTLRGENISGQFKSLIDTYVHEKYSKKIST